MYEGMHNQKILEAIQAQIEKEKKALNEEPPVNPLEKEYWMGRLAGLEFAFNKIISEELPL